MKGRIIRFVSGLLMKSPSIESEYERAVAKRILAALPAFVPNSAGPSRERASLTLLGARQTFPFLCELLASESVCPHGEEQSIETVCDDSESREAAGQLQSLFNKHGSDKSTSHNYHWLYGRVLRKPLEITNVLEVGLGTNNVDVISHMGKSGTPGASLRAFREYLPKATIYGADIDRRILFEDDRIRTFFVDQTDLKSFQDLDKVTPDEFDLIVDDGLHAPNANIATMIFALKKLKVGGWFVIEDIPDACRPVWRLVASILPAHYRTYLLTAKGAVVFAVERPAVATG